MKDLLRKAEVLVEDLEAKIIEHNVLVDENKLLLDKNQKKENVLKEREILLSRRESKVRDIEDIVAVKDSNVEKAKEIKKDMAQLNVERNAFVSYHEQVKKENQAKTDSLNASIKAVEAKEAKLNKDIADLKIEKKKMKENILKEIAKKI